MVGSSIAFKYYTRVEVANTLAFYNISPVMDVKSFIVRVLFVNVRHFHTCIIKSNEVKHFLELHCKGSFLCLLT
jgi:hypothetical protein